MESHPPSIFLSHAHEDKGFVHWLARHLRASGVRVWIDEAEVGVGDSLLEKLRGAISEMDYLGVVISPRSARSDWVTREVGIAMREDVAGQSVKVLPLLLRGGEPPPALAGTLSADFTSEPSYAQSLAQVAARLGVESARPDVSPDRLSELAASSLLLRAALEELRGDGISNATADALISAQVADVELSEFLSLIARELHGHPLFGLAISIVYYVDQRGVGQEALDFCLRSGELDRWQVSSIGLHMVYVTTPEGVLWCHATLTTTIRDDAVYYMFLERHADVVLDRCADDMTAYLLHPSRGPGSYNLVSFELAVDRLPDPAPFRRRWFDWINDGYFDREERPGREPATSLYQVLNRRWGEERFTDIADAIETHVHLLMKSPSGDGVRDGLYHLVAMVDAEYRGVDRVLENTVFAVDDAGAEERRLLHLTTRALQEVAALNRDPSDKDRKDRVRRLYLDIADADRTGITGHWTVRP